YHDAPGLPQFPAVALALPSLIHEHTTRSRNRRCSGARCLRAWDNFSGGVNGRPIPLGRTVASRSAWIHRFAEKVQQAIEHAMAGMQLAGFHVLIGLVRHGDAARAAYEYGRGGPAFLV